MSGTTLPAGRRLLWRVGPYWNERKPEFSIGSTITVTFELVDRQTLQRVSALGFSCLAYRPRRADFDTQLAPTSFSKIAEGAWEVLCEAEMPGIYVIYGIAFGPIVAAASARISVIAGGNV